MSAIVMRRKRIKMIFNFLKIKSAFTNLKRILVSPNILRIRYSLQLSFIMKINIRRMTKTNISN